MNDEKIQAPVVITGHNNADFDALAAMIAASKLYPGAVLIFPGSQEKNLRDFFIQSATYLFDFRNMKDIDPASVNTLVVVDTRQHSRLNHIWPILENKGLEIHVYDHHPDTDEDLKAAKEVIEPWGSTTSILVREIQDKGLTLTPDEATILGCGIYEDTGGFGFASTTEQDFLAAAWLRTQNMDINVISDLLSRDLSAEQVALLSTLLESATTHEINGVKVVLAEVTMDHYVGDFALLAHKMLDMENIRVLFALGLMHDRIHVVARSRTADVDVGQICSSLGGGGHGYAASATVKDRTLGQVRDELFALLYSHINPQLIVRDLMSAPPVTVETTDSIAKAEEVMMRYGLKAVPVVEPGTAICAGLIEHQTADKAKSHGLGDIALKEYMQRDCAIIHPGSDLYPVMEIIVGQRQRLVPVVEDGDIIGVITRTDLINILIEEPARIPETLLPEKQRERNIRTLLQERLPQRLYDILVMAGELGSRMNCTVFAVGGFVRDILLMRDNLDLDLVVEGDGIEFARALAEKLGGRIRPHHKFKTAVIILPDDQRIDVATARLEYYEYPAALPTVELSSVKMDLFRRDFTINALAVQLNPGQMGRLVDFFGSRRDIKDKVIRVLHSLSFVEDPTRILRAVRFEQRFNFSIGKQTERLIKNAVHLDLMSKLSGTRIFHELSYILEERNPLSCLRRLQHFGVLEGIHRKLRILPAREHMLEESEKVLEWYRLLYLEPQPRPWILFMLGLTWGWAVKDVHSLARRLNLTQRQENDFVTLRFFAMGGEDKLKIWSNNNGKMSDLHELFEPMAVEGVLFLMAIAPSEKIRRNVSRYLTRLRDMEIELTGDDIIKLGVPAGPDVGRVLKKVLAARHDGKTPDRDSQLALARRIARDIKKK